MTLLAAHNGDVVDMRWRIDRDDDLRSALRAASYNDQSLRAVADEYRVSMSHCMALLSEDRPLSRVWSCRDVEPDPECWFCWGEAKRTHDRACVIRARAS